MRAAVQLIMSDKSRTWEICKDRMLEHDNEDEMAFESDGIIITYNAFGNRFIEIGELSVNEVENDSGDILASRRIGYDVSDMVSEMLQDYTASERNQVLSICCAFSLGECSEKQKSTLAGIIAGKSNEFQDYIWETGKQYGFIKENTL